MGVTGNAKKRLTSGLCLLRRVLPLPVRRRMVVAFGGRAWLPHRSWLTFELLRDFAETDPAAWHRFLWAHHLAYADSYEVERRFGDERIVPSRRMFFDDLRDFLVGRGIDPEREVASVFEVGCSLGYLLRHLETGLFRSATTLEGIDIDRRAVERGAAHLAGIGSRVKLAARDMTEVSEVLGARKVDVILCLGVLMYLPEAEARLVVRSILDHANVVAAFAGLADPSVDNARLTQPGVRQSDGTFIHNIDAMVRESGGEVAWRRWEGARDVAGNTIYFVFAIPPVAQ